MVDIGLISSFFRCLIAALSQTFLTASQSKGNAHIPHPCHAIHFDLPAPLVSKMDMEAGKVLAENIETKMDAGRIIRKCRIKRLSLYGIFSQIVCQNSELPTNFAYPLNPCARR